MVMKFELEEYHRGITNEELIAELKRVAFKLNKVALNRTDNDEHGKMALRHIFEDLAV